MKKHVYRTALIWTSIIVGLLYIYPTIGWMALSPESREAKRVQFESEDTEWAKSRHGVFSEMFFSAKRWAQCDPKRIVTLGLDLQGGIHMVLRCDYRELPADKLKVYEDGGWSAEDIQKQIQETVLNQITRRVNDFEAQEPVIQTLGSDRIQIQLPGEKDLDRARRLIMMTAVLNFHIVAGNDESSAIFKAIEDAFPNELRPFVHSAKEGLFPLRVRVEDHDRVKRVIDQAVEKGGIIPDDKVVAFSQPPKSFEEPFHSLYVMDKAPLAKGEGLTSAYAQQDETNPPYWEILFRMNNAAGEQFGVATEANINRAMAIVLDGRVVSAPTIRDRITSSGQISGSFEAEEANDLAIALNSGSMAVPIHEEFTRIIGPTLGRETVRSGVVSSVASLIIVCLFMLVYYRLAGIVANIALVLNGILIIAAMSYFDMTLTLPGIAGLILTIGMAVDANVLIYERMREELKRGHSIQASIQAGFSRAASAILDSNITTLIAAVVLLQFGTGPVQGFAITLSIGIVSSVFTAMLVCQAVFDFLYSKGQIKKLGMMSFMKESGTHIRFMEMGKPAMIASAIFIIVGLAVFVMRGKDNLGVDFTQGTNATIAVASSTPVSADALRAAVESAGFESPVVQEMGAEETGFKNEFNLKVRDVEGSASAAAPGEAPVTVADRIKRACAPLSDAKAESGITILDEQTVGPAVGKQLSWDATKAMFWALVFVILYLTPRFELKYAMGAVIAVVHDVLVTVGAFALLGKQLDMTVIAALLTIIGYSLNDTIVIFDRIREDLRLYRGKGYSVWEIMNIAINVTLARTILTTLTVLFVVVVLFFFGGPAIQDFALAMIIGCVSGTYSTVFIATPVVYMWQKMQGRLEPSEARGTRSKPQEKASPATV